MADDDEIDVLGDFSFNSCLAQNRQGIPSCSDHEDTVHPQWLLDSTVNNWYDREDNRFSSGTLSRVNASGILEFQIQRDMRLIWNQAEKDLLAKGMVKYGRDVKKISQSLTTKTEAEIQALIEAEYGINLDPPTQEMLRSHDNIDDEIPAVVQEEVITDDDTPNISNVLNIVATGSTTVPIVHSSKIATFRSIIKKNSRLSLLKPEVLVDIKKTNSDISTHDFPDLIYDEDLTIGSTEHVATDESVGHLTNLKKVGSNPKRKKLKKMGNHRIKTLKNKSKDKNVIQKQRCKKADKLMAPRHRKESIDSEYKVKSPKMQIVLGSGQAIPLFDGEQVIKIEKKNSDVESDIEVDIDSDDDRIRFKPKVSSEPTVLEDTKKDTAASVEEEKPAYTTLKMETSATSQRSLERLLKRKIKIDLEGGGGCTIAHTAAGDVYAVAREPKRRLPLKPVTRPPTIPLIRTLPYNDEKPAPFTVTLCVSALVCMDVQAHCSRDEVMGLLGGEVKDTAKGRELLVRAYRPAAAAASRTHCDMCPVSQAMAAERLRNSGAELVGWHHSHPRFPPNPSSQDLCTQMQLQQALERPAIPCVGIITSQHWPVGRNASQYKCIRAELNASGQEVGYQLSARLQPDLTEHMLAAFLQQLRDMVKDRTFVHEFTLDLVNDVCPDAKITYLKKCLSSARHHMRSAGYVDQDPLVTQLLRGIAHIFR